MEYADILTGMNLPHTKHWSQTRIQKARILLLKTMGISF